MELKRVLERIPYPRGRQGRDYGLWSVLGLILVSMLCGRRGMKAAFPLGRSLTREQKRQLGFMRGHTPCHATLTETLRILDAQAVADSWATGTKGSIVGGLQCTVPHANM